MPDYARNIEAAKQEAIDALNAEAPQMESTTYDILLQVIDDTFDTKAGKITVDKDFVKKLNKMTQDVIDLIQKSPDFKGPVSKFVGSMNQDVSGAISAFQQNINDIAVPAFSEIKKVVIDETIDQMLGNGLNQNFVQPLRDLIYQNATAGLSQSQAKKNILEYIKGGKDKSGKLSRYIDMTAQQAADSYSGAINKKLLETFKYDGLLITGSLIDTSSPQCRYAIVELGGKISRDSWSDVVAHSTAKYPLIPGTTFDNVPINRLHWGCRHSFFPIILKKQKPIELEYKNVAFQETHDFKSMSSEEINSHLKAAGIPDIPGGKVVIFKNSETNISIKLKSKDITMSRILDLKAKTIENEFFSIESFSKYKGQGAKIFKNQADEAIKQGYISMSTYAVRDNNKNLNGYYVWARLGYKPSGRFKSIIDAIKNFNTANATDVQSLEELVATKKGQDFWKINGNSFEGIFDLKKDSYSMNTLNNYIDGKRK